MGQAQIGCCFWELFDAGNWGRGVSEIDQCCQPIMFLVFNTDMNINI